MTRWRPRCGLALPCLRPQHGVVVQVQHAAAKERSLEETLMRTREEAEASLQEMSSKELELVQVRDNLLQAQCVVEDAKEQVLKHEVVLQGLVNTAQSSVTQDTKQVVLLTAQAVRSPGMVEADALKAEAAQSLQAMPVLQSVPSGATRISPQAALSSKDLNLD